MLQRLNIEYNDDDNNNIFDIDIIDINDNYIDNFNIDIYCNKFVFQ